MLLRQVKPRGSVLPYVPVGIIVGLVYRRPGLGQQFDERHVPLLRGSEERGPATLQYSIHAHATLAQQLPCTINVPGQGFATTVSERSSFEKQFQKSLKCLFGPVCQAGTSVVLIVVGVERKAKRMLEKVKQPFKRVAGAVGAVRTVGPGSGGGGGDGSGGVAVRTKVKRA